MTRESQDRRTLEDTVRSLTAEATELETRISELRRALTGLDEQMRTVSDALHRIPHSGEHISG
jgi:prefoldin subunit 5